MLLVNASHVHKVVKPKHHRLNRNIKFQLTLIVIQISARPKIEIAKQRKRVHLVGTKELKNLKNRNLHA